MRNQELDNLQIQASTIWSETKRGTVILPTGHGKTFVALNCFINGGYTDMLFLAETTLRRENVLKDVGEYIKYKGVDPLENKRFHFMCYQSLYKMDNLSFPPTTLVICDEIHDMLTPKYIRCAELISKYDVLGLSATVSAKKKDGVSKRDMLQSINIPPVYEYSLSESLEKGTSRNLEIHIIRVPLGTSNNVHIKTKTAEFVTSEAKNYAYLTEQCRKAIYMKNEFLIKRIAFQRASMLYNLKSKMPIVKNLLHHLSDKRGIIYGNSIEMLTELCPHVIHNKNKNNQKLLDDMNEFKFNHIGGFKMLEQGQNIKSLDFVLLTSYFSTDKQFLQRVGRLRFSGETGHVYILCTIGTKEEDWLNNMLMGVPNIKITNDAVF